MCKVGSIGITSVAISPLRILDSDTSEQVSQTLAGEHIKILEKGRGKWVKIKSLNDNYVGWTDGHHFKFNFDSTSDSCMLKSTISKWREESSGAELWLPAGSMLTYNNDGEYMLSGSVVIPCAIDNPLGEKQESLSKTALKFLKAPYQWGGRTVSGIDCSGLSQTVAKLNGFAIPRDASQQVKSGVAADWGMRCENDLAFFENKKGAITHVGILTSKDEIIHASGYVRVDKLTVDGIFNVKEDRITHKLTCLRRLK
ncbi:C40 family peptidase [Flavobacteriales bacterium]|nr:C40 family peptidase [Flavobacteriales bacterium]